jgi:hypothetical protein
MTSMTGPDERRARGRPSGSTLTFRERDISAAIRAAKKAGLENFRVDVDKSGTISVVPTAPDESADAKGAKNQWDDDL